MLNFDINETTKFFLQCFSVLSTLVLSIATIIIAIRQYYISKQQKDIALYEHHYYKIYKLFFDTIQKQQDILMSTGNFYSGELQKTSDYFFEQLNFVKFLVKESDFNKITGIYTQITMQIVTFFSDNQNVDPRERLENYKIFNQQLTKYKSDFVDIITPYLQIEKENFLFIWFRKLKNIDWKFWHKNARKNDAK